MKDSFRIQIKKSYNYSNGKTIHVMKDNTFIVMDSYNMIIKECETFNEAREVI